MTKVVIDKEVEVAKLEGMLENLTDDKDKQSVRFAINLLRGFNDPVKMKCPYRKQTRQKGKDLLDCVEEEHYMECYGEECPQYDGLYNLCKRAEGEYFHATHLGGNK